MDRPTPRKAKVLTAKRNTSVDGLLAAQIAALVGEDDTYEQAHRRALALLEQGLPLGRRIESTRNQWHDQSRARRRRRGFGSAPSWRLWKSRFTDLSDKHQVLLVVRAAK